MKENLGNPHHSRPRKQDPGSIVYTQAPSRDTDYNTATYTLKVHAQTLAYMARPWRAGNAASVLGTYGKGGHQTDAHQPRKRKSISPKAWP